MSSYEQALVRQVTERELGLCIDECVEATIDERLAEADDVLDPFNRERLKRNLVEELRDRTDQWVDLAVTKTLRRAGKL